MSITPMRAQLTAADPQLSVWVAANAGTGKTKVLTDRVLRLLLAGTAPSRILCITYTKAAAAEMENRIHTTLSDWVAMDDAALALALRKLCNEAPDAAALRRARSLFATVLDAPDGVRIQTIHSFCQSLLRRFPLEAGVQPHFEVIDDRTSLELVAEARQRLFTRSQRGEEAWLRDSVTQLAERLSEGRFQDLLDKLIDQRRHLVPLLMRPSGVIRLITDAYAELDVPYGQTEEALFTSYFDYEPLLESTLRECGNQLLSGGKTDCSYGGALMEWLASPVAERPPLWPEYRKIWYDSKGMPRGKLITVGLAKACPALDETLRREQQRVVEYDNRWRALQTAKFTESAINVTDALLSIYNHLKAAHQFIDYDDLVMQSVRLLHRPGIAPWVLFKLDGGLDHLLIDEAQDTSPEQWQLVEKLAEEFFAGQGRSPDDVTRTLFVVGDEKQSIYSFQGAAPQIFSRKRQEFSERAQGAKREFRPLELSVSFRSTEAVLAVVDAVISQPHVQAGLSFEGRIAPHEAHRAGQAGLVEFWPLTVGSENERQEAWDIAQATVNVTEPDVILAERIAQTIRGWLDRGERLESQNRPIRAGDVLVLVRSRRAFMYHLVRALKRLDVPVAGVDRMRLTQNIAVMDLLALAEFLLLPEDDLSLAALLKSPLCGISEEQLFALAYGRDTSLWNRLRQMAGEMGLAEVAGWLESLLEQVDYLRPYELFAFVLEQSGGRAKFAARLGQEAFDPLDEFLSLALDYERTHAPSLQGFLHWVRTGDTEIKRDMEQGVDAVRIMTVHSSKGLQAPIVFLPDTVDAPGKGGNSVPPPLWTQRNGERVMLWSPMASQDDAVTGALRDAYKQAEEEESRRLLYVALTRAEDRLYIGGVQGSRKLPDNCWYHWILSGVEGMMQPERRLFPPAVPGQEPEEVEVLCYRSAQTAEARSRVDEAAAAIAAPLPDYLRQPPAAEPYPPQPLVPSRSDDESVQASGVAGAVLSPVAETARFRRGNVIHRLLQWLPDTAEPQRPQAAREYLARYAAEFSEAEREALAAEVLTVLAHPAMAPVFAEGALAEVPVSGLVSLTQGAAPRILSGQIDRLRVTEEAVWIVDYKTQRRAPERAEDVPEAYLRQMAVYQAALRGIYPGRPIHCALLWTAEPRLMLLPPDLLASSLDSARN